MAERLPEDAPLVDRVRVLAVLQDEAGYLAEALVADDGAIRLREHNCAIDKISRRTTAACDAELDLFRELLGPGVVREIAHRIGRSLLHVPGRVRPTDGARG